MIFRVVFKLFGILLIFLSLGLCLLFPSCMKRRQKILQGHLRLISWVLAIRIHFEGVHEGRDPPLLIANHVSYLDIFIIGSLFPTSFLAKIELSTWPLLSYLGKAAETIFVERLSVLSRLRALFEIKASLHERNICIFPEGTTTAAVSPRKESWHRGYAYLVRKSQIPLYCLGLHYGDQKDIAWIGDDSLFPHLLRICARKRIDVYVAGSSLRFHAWENATDIVEISYKTVATLSKQAATFRPTFARLESKQIDKAAMPLGHCRKGVAKGLKVGEDWKGIIEY